MKKVVCGMVLAATLVLPALPAVAATTCLKVQDIQSTDTKDGGVTLLFKMRDGSSWSNKLQHQCYDLKFNGFAWTVANPDGSVCENQQTMRVLQSGELCSLGKFTQLTQKKG